jgi:Heterokaryon incompatibility protein (HET)
MEHLIYDPDLRTLRTEVRAAANQDLDIPDWQEYDQYYGYCEPICPQIPWLGHDHAASSYYRRVREPQPMLKIFCDCYGKGWDLDQLFDTGDIRQVHQSYQSSPESDEILVRQTAGFIQAWLYFGLLEAVVGRPISTTYFVRVGADGQPWIYSRNLSVLLEAWMKTIGSLESEFKENKLRLARQCASTALMLFHDTSKRCSGDRKPATTALLQSLLRSIEPALSTLFEAIIRWTEVHLRMEIQLVNTEILGSPKLYLEQLIERGWCRFVIASAEIALPASFLRYVDAMKFTAKAEGHWRCTVQRCERNYIRRETYTQRHWPQKCRCSFIKPKLIVAREILDAGFIPLVRLNDIDNSLELGGAHPEDNSAEYIAFSHVWADGLGSSAERGLPTCQVQRLSRLAGQQLTYSSWFWIDGLCVPEKEPYRGKAIQLMKSTYQNATGVIVLDEGLRCLSVRSSHLEIGWSLFASGWFSRLWTYQEGFLPPWVDLELSDGLIDLSTLLRNLYNIWNERKGTRFPALYVRDLVAVLQKARPLAPSPNRRSRQKRLVDLFNALTRRDSSRPDDQLLVIGLLLGINIQSLRDVPSLDRWQAFYLSLQQIPWTIVFDRRPKIRTHPFCWAPATWISAGQDEWLHYDEDLAEITSEGLKVSLNVLLLTRTCPTTFSAIFIRTEPYIYELIRQDIAQISSLQTFNCIIIRYFVDENPEFQLAKHRAVYMRVGLGLIDHPTGTGLRYDCTTLFEIQLFADNDETEMIDGDIVEGSWQEMQMCFT